MKANSLLLIFTRNPEFGKVKTRLAKEIGDQAALDVYTFLLQHTFSVTKNLEVSKEVYYSDSISETDIWDPVYFGKKLQQGKDLGERMENAFRSGFQKGFQKILVIGSDLFDLKPEDLLTAFKELDSSELVLGPAQDGGYYLIGMNKLNEDVFKNKKWGTNSVLRETLDDLKNQKVSLLEIKNDIDTLEDLEGFQELYNMINKNGKNDR